jgi:hypothetical protein
MKMEYNYNYVYRITHKIENKHYYGVRSCNVEPKLDLGTKYFSSSRDKEFRNDQKNHSENYKYKIVRICSTRKKADALEIKLQKKFNVGINESFYNKATRTSMGFSIAGTNLSPETRKKMSEAQKGVPKSDETRQKMSEANKGVPKSDETRQKMSEAKTCEKNPMFGKEHTPEAKQKMSEAKLGEKNNRFGINHTPETKQKMSESRKGVHQEQVECPHCGKIGGISNMTRWHFDNCEYKKI